MGEEYSTTAAPASWREQDWAQKLPETIERGAEHLLSLQATDGYWKGELEADSTLESDYIYYLFVLGKANPVRVAKLANYVRSKQLEDGGWNLYPGGPSELNATCKAYFALKLAGDDANAPHLTAARDDFKDSARLMLDRADVFVFRRGLEEGTMTQPPWMQLPAQLLRQKPSLLQREGDPLPEPLFQLVKRILESPATVLV